MRILQNKVLCHIWKHNGFSVYFNTSFQPANLYFVHNDRFVCVGAAVVNVRMGMDQKKVVALCCLMVQDLQANQAEVVLQKQESLK